uniref:DegT/DnrJ/EryC1/StrS aminotransferase n=1 Tax=Magnetococcus massalia (strain MO-1) TaxID=451514 RepID=A0A1S7LLF6_MAGMO|nr:Conserved protein of unknown function. Containing pyridoxal phosphate-dependent transferase, major region [Candidatus Magnetococcus massalia]
MHRETMKPIPLYHADLTQQDHQQVIHALEQPQWQDAEQTAQLEAFWSARWQRPTLALADPHDAITVLAELLQWRMGDAVALPPLMEPIWAEAFIQRGIQPAWLDLDPKTGHGGGQPMGLEEIAGSLKGWLDQATMGLPHFPFTLPTTLQPLVDISHAPLPLWRAQKEAILILQLDANLPLQGGGLTLLLLPDHLELEQARQLRPRLPSRAAVALANSQSEQVEQLMQYRRHVAERYLEKLRPRGLFALPWYHPLRNWAFFNLDFADRRHASEFCTFLQGAQIGCQLGCALPPPHQRDGMQRYQQRSVLIPLYGALQERDQKRIINRIHRWVERQ